jgi:hypothetical protein
MPFRSDRTTAATATHKFPVHKTCYGTQYNPKNDQFVLKKEIFHCTKVTKSNGMVSDKCYEIIEMPFVPRALSNENMDIVF